MRKASPFLVLVIAGCSGNWQPLVVPTRTPLAEKTVVEFRSHDSLIQMHGVRFTNDSLSGIPWLDHLSCDTCRKSYALARISEVKTGDPSAGARTMALPFAMFFGAGLVVGLLCAITNSCHWD